MKPASFRVHGKKTPLCDRNRLDCHLVCRPIYYQVFVWEGNTKLGATTCRIDDWRINDPRRWPHRFANPHGVCTDGGTHRFGGIYCINFSILQVACLRQEVGPDHISQGLRNQ